MVVSLPRGTFAVVAAAATAAAAADAPLAAAVVRYRSRGLRRARAL